MVVHTSVDMAVSLTRGDICTGTKVPSGVRVKWFQRAWVLYVEIEAPELETPEISISDDGQITMNAAVAGTPQTISLQLLHPVVSKQCR